MRKFTTVLQLIRILSNHQRKTVKVRPNRSSIKNIYMYPQSYLRYYLLLKTVVKLAKIHVLFNFYKLEQNND